MSKKQRDAHRKRTKEYAAFRRRKNGVPLSTSSKPAVNRKSPPRVPYGPLKALIEKDFRTKKDLAAIAGISEKSFRRAEQSGSMSLFTADRVCVALDTPLSIVYPEI